MSYQVLISEYNEETQVHSTGYKNKFLAKEIADFMNSKSYSKTYWVGEVNASNDEEE